MNGLLHNTPCINIAQTHFYHISQRLTHLPRRITLPVPPPLVESEHSSKVVVRAARLPTNVAEALKKFVPSSAGSSLRNDLRKVGIPKILASTQAAFP